MKTKTTILKRANQEFPEHWEFMCTQDRKLRSLNLKTFPTVLSMTVGEITHHYGTEARVTLTIKTEEEETTLLEGKYSKNHHGSICEFPNAAGLKQFAEVFADNLIGNVMCEEGVWEITEWPDLPY